MSDLGICAQQLAGMVGSRSAPAVQRAAKGETPRLVRGCCVSGPGVGGAVGHIDHVGGRPLALFPAFGPARLEHTYPQAPGSPEPGAAPRRGCDAVRSMIRQCPSPVDAPPSAICCVKPLDDISHGWCCHLCACARARGVSYACGGRLGRTSRLRDRCADQGAGELVVAPVASLQARFSPTSREGQDSVDMGWSRLGCAPLDTLAT